VAGVARRNAQDPQIGAATIASSTAARWAAQRPAPEQQLGQAAVDAETFLGG